MAVGAGMSVDGLAHVRGRPTDEGETLMDALAQVTPLALLDTLSLSTLAIPLWFLLTPRGLRAA